jgi:ferredoxin
MDYLLFLGLGGAAVLLGSVYRLKQMSNDADGWWTTSLLQGRRVSVKTDWDLCVGSGTCTELAPEMFRLDWSRKKSIFDPAPLQVDENGEASAEDIFRAAQSCPYRAISLYDKDTGEKIFPQW